MTKPSKEQLNWLESLRIEQYDAYSELYKHVTTVSWDDEAFLFNGHDELIVLKFQDCAFLLYKYLEIILKHKPKREFNGDFFYIFNYHLGTFLAEPTDKLELIYQWMMERKFSYEGLDYEEEFTSNHRRWEGLYNTDNLYVTPDQTLIYITIKYYLHPNSHNILYLDNVHFRAPYIYNFNKTALLKLNTSVSLSQIDWIEQALKLEQLYGPGVELEAILSRISWDIPEFLGACNMVFYSSQYETARFIAMKYIKLSLKLKAKTPVASADLMHFLYKNLGALLHSPKYDLELLLEWFDSVYIPPRTPIQLNPWYEDTLNNIYIEVERPENSKSPIETFHYLLTLHDAERTVYRTLKAFYQSKYCDIPT